MITLNKIQDLAHPSLLLLPKRRALCPVALNVVIESGFELDDEEEGSESSEDLEGDNGDHGSTKEDRY